MRASTLFGHFTVSLHHFHVYKKKTIVKTKSRKQPSGAAACGVPVHLSAEPDTTAIAGSSLGVVWPAPASCHLQTTAPSSKAMIREKYT